MAKEGEEQTQITISVPMRRLLTGVPRTQRAPAAIPRVKRYVLRHIDPKWRDLIWDEDRSVHRIWIDDFLNQTIWSRGRGHVGGPDEWIAAKKEGQRPRLAKRTTSRYGSTLKVTALLVQDREGEDPRVEVKLFGYEDKAAEEETGHEGHDHEPGEGHDDEGGEDEAKEAPKKPVSTSAAAKGGKPAAAKGEAKKAAPKKEGGD